LYKNDKQLSQTNPRLKEQFDKLLKQARKHVQRLDRELQTSEGGNNGGKTTASG